MQEIITFALYIIPDSSNNTLDLHMKQIYIILLAALCFPYTPAAMAQETPAAGIWRPAGVTEYECPFWDEGEDTDWTELSTTTFTYDERGNITKENTSHYTGMYTVATYTYDDLNRILTSETTDYENGAVSSATRKEYAWDTIVPDFCTSLMVYNYYDGNWYMTSDSETTSITRDAAGNVTEVITSRCNDYTDEMIPYRQLIWTYDTEGKAIALKAYNLNVDTGPYELDRTINDITWKNTNGQLLSSELEDYLEGENRISAANAKESTDSYNLVAEYDTHKQGEYFATVITKGSTLESTVSKVYTDDCGSYEKIISVISEYTDDNGNQCKDLIVQDRNIVTRNKSGKIIDETNDRYEAIFSSGTLSGTKTVNQYDDDGNLAESVIYNYIAYGLPDETEIHLIPRQRFVYGPYNDVTNSISTIKISDTYPAAVFNTQGIAVKAINSESELNSLPAGFYIVNGRKYVSR